MPQKPPSLYAQFFTGQERQDLEGIPPDDLTGEINLQRSLLVIIQAASPAGPLDFKVQLEKTRASNLAIHALLSLIRAERDRRDIRPEWAQLILGAGRIAAEQMGVPGYLLPERTRSVVAGPERASGESRMGGKGPRPASDRPVKAGGFGGKKRSTSPGKESRPDQKDRKTERNKNAS